MTVPIVQEHGFGCGVACVAYVLGLSYAEALALFDMPHKAEAKGYWCRELVAALAKAGRAYRHHFFRERYAPFLQMPGTIVFVKRCTAYPAGHYLVRADADLWMNPWSNFPVGQPRQAGWQRDLPHEIGYILFPQGSS